MCVTPGFSFGSDTLKRTIEERSTRSQATMSRVTPGFGFGSATKKTIEERSTVTL